MSGREVPRIIFRPDGGKTIVWEPEGTLPPPPPHKDNPFRRFRFEPFPRLARAERGARRLWGEIHWRVGGAYRFLRTGEQHSI